MNTLVVHKLQSDNIISYKYEFIINTYYIQYLFDWNCVNVCQLPSCGSSHTFSQFLSFYREPISFKHIFYDIVIFVFLAISMGQTKKVYDFLQKQEETTHILRFFTKFFRKNILDYCTLDYFRHFLFENPKPYLILQLRLIKKLHNIDLMQILD